jgi:adenylate cyclase class 2
MNTEIEAKFPDVDAEALRKALQEKGARLEYPEVLMRRKTFDYPDQRLYKIGGWIRVRDEGDKVTLSYKQLNDRTLHGTQEVDVVVDDFENTCRFFDAIGMTMKSYQETKREKWNYKGVEVTLDTWPCIPTFAELEGPTEELVREVVSDLGFDRNNAMHGSVEPVYQMHYDFTDKEIDSWESITFIAPPDWLLAKKKK